MCCIPRIILAALLAATVALQAAQPLYKIDTLAGTNSTGDGKAAAAAIMVQPQAVAVTSMGAVYISDSLDHRVRRIGADGTIQTYAGIGIAGRAGDGGAANKAQLNAPYGLTVDPAGSLYIADLGNAVVRKVSTDGTIATFAGGGKDAPPATGSVRATQVRLVQPRDVTVDRIGNVLIADFGANQVYSVDQNGMLSVVPAIGLSYPSSLTVDATGALYIADSGNKRVRVIRYSQMSTLSDPVGHELEFGTITGIAVDSSGTVYVADGTSSRITVVKSGGDFSTLPLGGASICATPWGELYIVGDRQVRKYTSSMTSIVIGAPGANLAGDGKISSEWRFSSPSSITRDASGSLWIADTGLSRVRRLTSTGELSTYSTDFDSPVSLTADGTGRILVGIRGNSGVVYRIASGFQAQPIATASGRALLPAALAYAPDGSLYIADSLNNVIRRVAADGSMTIVAGGGTATGDGVGLALKLASPSGVAVDAAGVVWFSEAAAGRIRKLRDRSQVTTVTGLDIIEPHGMRFDRTGNLWVADAGANRIYVMAPDGSWSSAAGSGDRGFSGDGALANGASLNAPLDVWPEADGSVLIADTGNNRIRALKAVPGEPTTPVTPVDPVPPPAAATSPITVLHAATLKETAVAPGQLAYVAGAGISESTEVLLDGTRIEVLDKKSGSLTFQIPTTARSGSAEVSTRKTGTVFGRTSVKISDTAPGILAVSDGTGQALVLNPDSSRNDVDHPAGRRDIVSFFVTGQGTGNPVVTAEIGGYSADVIWSGAAPGLTGVYQVNVQMPGGFAPSGSVVVRLLFNGVPTQSGVTIVSR